MSVHVCPTKDIECGDRPGNWCSECPKHQQAINWKDPDTRESAMAAKWAEAEDKVRVLRDALEKIERTCLIDPPYSTQLLQIGMAANRALEATK